MIHRHGVVADKKTKKQGSIHIEHDSRQKRKRKINAKEMRTMRRYL